MTKIKCLLLSATVYLTNDPDQPGLQIGLIWEAVAELAVLAVGFKWQTNQRSDQCMDQRSYP